MLHHFVDNLSYHLLRRAVACLDVFCPNSIVVTCITFFRLSMAVCASPFVSSGIIITAFSFCVRSCSRFLEGFALLLRIVLLHKACCRYSPKTWAIPFLDVIVSPFSFFTFGMSVLFLPDFMHDMFLMPLNSSGIRCIISCLFVLFSVADALFDPLAHFSQLLSVSFRDASSCGRMVFRHRAIRLVVRMRSG